MTQIFINDNIPNHATQRGVTRSFNEISNSLITKFGANVTIYSSQNRSYGLARRIYALPTNFRGHGRLKIHEMNEWLASWAIQFTQAKVVYCPYYGNLNTKAHSVFIVHDMIHELFPQYFPSSNKVICKFIQEKKKCFEKATLLIAVSQNTAKDIVQCYPHIDPDKIISIYHGVADFFYEGTNIRMMSAAAPSKPYFLYIGHRDLYKNFFRLLTAFGQSGLAHDFDLRVISPHGKKFTEEEVACINKYQMQNSVYLIFAASDEIVRKNYAFATAFVYPSEYEGFGLPILEAMASGTLVATSNTASMPEVGSDKALYFDPYSTESIANTLEQIVNLSENEYRERITSGIAHARTFTWQTCQQKTIEAINHLL